MDATLAVSTIGSPVNSEDEGDINGRLSPMLTDLLVPQESLNDDVDLCPLSPPISHLETPEERLFYAPSDDGSVDGDRPSPSRSVERGLTPGADAQQDRVSSQGAPLSAKGKARLAVPFATGDAASDTLIIIPKAPAPPPLRKKLPKKAAKPKAPVLPTTGDGFTRGGNKVSVMTKEGRCE